MNGVDAIFALFGMALGFCAVVVAFVFPIIALAQIASLKKRLRELTLDMRELRAAGPRAAVVDVEDVPAVPELELAPREKTVGREPWGVEQKAEEHVPRSTAHVSAAFDWSKIEAWLGMRGLGWTAMVLLVFAGAYFLKVIYDQGLLGELGRVIVIVILGVILCWGGWVCHKRDQRVFCQMLTSGGVVLLYLATYFTFGDVFQVKILHRDQAAPFLILLVAETLALAALYNAPVIAAMAVAGGLLAPILLTADVDQYRSLFTYLTILNAGVLVLMLFRRWWGVASLALVGTQGLFWLWYGERYHESKLLACVLFQLGIFALYLGEMLAVQVRKRKLANVEELVRLVVLTVLLAAAGYTLLDPGYHRWLGSYAIGLATVFALLAGLITRFRAEDEPLLFVLIALSMAAVAAVFPLQTDAAWIAVGWAAQGLALWWFGLRIRSAVLYGMGAVFLVLSLIRLIFVDTFGRAPHVDPFIPLFNHYGFPAVMVAAAVILAAVLQRHTRPGPNSPNFVVMRLFGLAGVVALWIICSVECYDFFVVRGNLYSSGVQARLTTREREMLSSDLINIFDARAQHLRLLAHMSLSALWAVFALVLLAIGLRLRNRPLRWLALALFAVTLGKVMLVDTAQLPDYYRVGAIFALSLMMAAGAWAYQKLRRVLAADVEGQHEPAM